MLFRCYSWGSFNIKVYANGIANETSGNFHSTTTANTPKWDLIFCRFSFPFLLCIIKSRREKEKKSLALQEKKKKEEKVEERKILVVCKSLHPAKWKAEKKVKQRKFFWNDKVSWWWKCFRITFPNLQSNRLKAWHFAVT